jgi:hypothetical protein
MWARAGAKGRWLDGDVVGALLELEPAYAAAAVTVLDLAQQVVDLRGPLRLGRSTSRGYS